MFLSGGLLSVIIYFTTISTADSFTYWSSSRHGRSEVVLFKAKSPEISLSIDEATAFLSEWDRLYSIDNPNEPNIDNIQVARSKIISSLIELNIHASEERANDSTTGR